MDKINFWFNTACACQLYFCLENLDHSASRVGLVPSDRNLAEFEACILGLEAALGFEHKKIICIWRLNAICQEKGEWQTKEEKIIPYQEYLSKLAEEFEKIEFTHQGREGKSVCRCFGHTSFYG